jgi:hypothetical protein
MRGLEDDGWRAAAIARWKKHADSCHLCKHRPLACAVGQGLLGIASGMRVEAAPIGQLEMAPVLQAAPASPAPRKQKAAEQAELKPHFVFERVRK